MLPLVVITMLFKNIYINYDNRINIAMKKIFMYNKAIY
ncbi:hypothetical protein BJV41_004782 [Clostridium beijerinckii]|nr:hypothetical protein [Clostridium beijerinckii]NOW33076.1 hypothetical protein [Clostridium beijerinckii]NRT80300.1 hypothetical protein [Clostridium beijerinckii]OOM45185.1 hypothetical protein CBEIJ_34310 [Clostridium beijerinckii]